MQSVSRIEVGNRKETKPQLAHCRVLSRLHDKGLIEDLEKSIKKGKPLKIKETREQLGLSQSKCGKLMAMLQPAIGSIVSGRRTETLQHQALCRALSLLHDHDLIRGLQHKMDYYHLCR